MRGMSGKGIPFLNFLCEKQKESREIPDNRGWEYVPDQKRE